MLIAIIAIFTFLVFIVSVMKGRMAGIALTGVGSAILAFFLMPPFFSFRVTQMRDMLTLAFFGTAGLVLTQTAPSRKRRVPAAAGVSNDPGPLVPARSSGADLANAVAHLDSFEVGGRLREVALAISVDGCALLCTADETFRILSDAVNAGLAVPGVKRISIYSGQRPSARLLKVVAHRVWPMPENETVTTGRRESNCTPADFPGWPPQARANWFDNGYDRIYQIWVETTGEPGNSVLT